MVTVPLAQIVVKSVENRTGMSLLGTYNLVAFVQHPAETAMKKSGTFGHLTCHRK